MKITIETKGRTETAEISEADLRQMFPEPSPKMVDSGKFRKYLKYTGNGHNEDWKWSFGYLPECRLVQLFFEAIKLK